MDFKSKGYKNCEMITEKLKEFNKTELSFSDIKILIMKHIGSSTISVERYFRYLILFGFVKRTDSENIFDKKEFGVYVIC